MKRDASGFEIYILSAGVLFWRSAGPLLTLRLYDPNPFSALNYGCN